VFCLYVSGKKFDYAGDKLTDLCLTVICFS